MRGKILMLILLITSVAQAQLPAGALAQKFAFDGVLLDNSSNPITVLTTIRFTVYNPAVDCILYEEDHAVTPDSFGNFSVEIGAGSPTVNNPSLFFPTIFQNTSQVRAPGANCGSGYTPSPGHARKLRVTIDPTGSPSVLTPEFQIASLPMATVAETLQGLPPSNFLQTGTGNLTQADVQTVFGAANYSELIALLAGTSTKYATESSGAGTTLPGYTTGTPPGSPVAGSLWYDTTSNVVKFYDGSSTQTLSSGGGTVTSVATGTGLTGGPITATGTISLANTAVSPGTYSGLTIDAQGRVTAAAVLAIGDLPASAVRTGGQPGAMTVGTSDANSFSLLTNGASSLYISSAGDVGIGSVGPGKKLDVVGNNNAIPVLGIKGAAGQSTYLFEARDSANTLLYSLDQSGTPTAPTDITDKAYVDSAVSAGAISGLTAGRVPYAASPTTLADSANLVWDNTNSRLGVGTAPGAYKFHVDTGGGGGIAMFSSSTNSNALYATSGGTNATIDGANTSATGTGVYGHSSSSGNGVVAHSNTGTPFLAWIGGGTEVFRIDNSGRVGIGTATPQDTLHVHKAAGTSNFVQISNTTTGQTATDGLWMGVSATGSAHLVQEENSYITIETNSTERMRILGSGEVGIGTTTPGAALEVATSFKYTGGSPAAGEYLKSDATGNATWEPLPAGLVNDSSSNTWTTGNQIINTGAVGVPGLIINGFAGQSAALLNVKDSSNNPIFTVDPATTYFTRADAVTNSASPIAHFENYDVTPAQSNGVSIKAGQSNSNYSLKVENQSSYPSFVIQGDGNVGIGTLAPAAQLDVVSTSATPGAILSQMYSSASANDAAGMRIRRARGTPGSPTSVNSSDVLGGIEFVGYDGSDFNDVSARIIARSTEIHNNGTGAHGTDLVFETFPENSMGSIDWRMIIKGNGNIGIGTATPNSMLEVGAPAPYMIMAPGLGAGVGPLNIGSTADWPKRGVIAIENELIGYYVQDATNLYLDQRGLYNTSAVAHTNPVPIAHGTILNSRNSTTQPLFMLRSDGTLNATKIGLGAMSPNAMLELNHPLGIMMENMTVAGPANSSAATISSTANWPPQGLIMADGEIMSYHVTGGASIMLDLRGLYGTTAVSHNTMTPVTFVGMISGTNPQKPYSFVTTSGGALAGKLGIGSTFVPNAPLEIRSNIPELSVNLSFGPGVSAPIVGVNVGTTVGWASSGLIFQNNEYMAYEVTGSSTIDITRRALYGTVPTDHTSAYSLFFVNMLASGGDTLSPAMAALSNGVMSLSSVSVGTTNAGASLEVKGYASYATTPTIGSTTPGQYPVGSTTSFPPSGVMFIDNEYMAFRVVNSTDVYLTQRGMYATTPSVHTISTEIKFISSNVEGANRVDGPTILANNTHSAGTNFSGVTPGQYVNASKALVFISAGGATTINCVGRGITGQTLQIVAQSIGPNLTVTHNSGCTYGEPVRTYTNGSLNSTGPAGAPASVSLVFDGTTWIVTSTAGF